MTTPDSEQIADRPDRPAAEASGPIVPDVVVKGDVVGGRVQLMRRDVEAAVAGGETRLVVDVSGAACFDEEAYGFLIDTARQLAREGGWLKLLNGARWRRLVDPLELEDCTGEWPEGDVACEMEELVTA